LEDSLTSLGLLVGTISHGIKGMLTGLDGGRYLVSSGLDKGDSDRVERGWDMVSRNVDQVRSMVLNILFYAKDRDPAYQTVSAPDMAAEVAALLSKRASDHAIQLTTEIDADAGTFEADEEAVRSMLVNLVENSLDACLDDEAKGEHRVALRLRATDEEIEFEVKDNGIGMDQETREKAFSLFFSSKGCKGTGLGLFIAHKIAQAHGGGIDLKSEVDKGACFVVKLPRRRSAAAAVVSEMEQEVAP